MCMCVLGYVCTWVCVHVCTWVCVHVCTWVCVHVVCVHVCTWVCVYVVYCDFENAHLYGANLQMANVRNLDMVEREKEGRGREREGCLN